MISDSLITGAKIALNSVNGNCLTNNSISNSKQTLGCVNYNNLNILDNTFPYTKVNFTGFIINDNNITDQTISFSKIFPASIGISGSQINPLTITNSNIQDYTITGTKQANLTITNANINDVAFSKITNTTNAITNTMINSVDFSKITNTTNAITNTMINSVDFSKITNYTLAIPNNSIGIQQLFTDFNTKYCPFMNRTNDGNTGLMFSSSTASNTPYNWITNNFHAYAAITPSTLGIKSGLNATQLKFGLNSGLFFCNTNYYNTVNNGDNSCFQTILIASANSTGVYNNGSGNGNVLLKGWAIGTTFADIWESF